MIINNLVPKKGGILEPEEAAKLVELVENPPKAISGQDSEFINPNKQYSVKQPDYKRKIKNEMDLDESTALEQLAGIVKQPVDELAVIDNGSVVSLKLYIKNVSACRLESVPKQIECFTNLEYLSFYRCSLKKVGNLNLPNLIGLSIDENFAEFEEIDLSNLPKLETLSLGSEVVDYDSRASTPLNIKGLENLTQLKALSFYDNYRVQYDKNLESVLNQLKNLEELNLGRTFLGYIPKLNLPNLKNLDLGDCYGKELANFGNLPSLQTLDLGDNALNDIKNLNLPNLLNLKLHNNNIREIKGLDNLPNLQVLDLHSNPISEIKNLDNLSNLDALDLQYNNITEIKNLENLEKLESLLLNNNKIREVKNLENLPNLSKLNLKNNPIENVKYAEYYLRKIGINRYYVDI